MTALQKHVMWFDSDGDGIVTPADTWNGFRSLGYGYTLSFTATVLTHVFMSYPTQDTWIPNSCNINVKNIKRCRHGSDSRVRIRPV